MSIQPPSSLTYGRVVGRFVLSVGDETNDVDEFPNAIPAVGSITITPANSITKEITVVPKTTVIRKPIQCALDMNGDLRGPSGAVGVWVTTGTHKVAYSLNGVTIQGHDIVVTEAHTTDNALDLLDYMSPGGPILAPSEYAELSARIDVIAASTGGGGTVADATTTTKGIVKLAGDLGGTADLPTVPALAGKSDTSHNHTGVYAPVRGADDNYVTDAEKVKLANLSGTNTGDQDLSSYLTTAAAPELVRDTMGTALVAGANVTITPNDAGDTITIAASGGGGGGGMVLAPLALLLDDTYAPLAPFGATQVNVGDTATDRISIAPVGIGATTTCASFAVNVATVAAGSNVRVAIYADTGTGHPGALIWDSGLIDSATTGIKTVTPGSAVTLPQGTIWVALSLSNASVNISGWKHAGLGLPRIGGFGFPTGADNYVMTPGSSPITAGFPASLAAIALSNKNNACPLVHANVTEVA